MISLLIENKQCNGDFLSRVACMIYDSECSTDRGICVIWPYSPDLLSPLCFDLELQFQKKRS